MSTKINSAHIFVSLQVLIFFGQVKNLKDQIEAAKGKDYPADNQRLIYAGKLVMLHATFS